MTPRSIDQRYLDPLDQVWLATAQRVGLRVERSADVYASTDGQRTLRIGTGDLDPDDCLAQMIFHELCHSLVEGPDAFTRPDWGLDNTSLRDRQREHACLRLQAHLGARFGLRRFLAPTTEYRAFYDALPADPFEPRRGEEVAAAIAGAHRAGRPPWSPHLEQALAATGAMVQRAAAFAGDDTLYGVVDPCPPPHLTGLPPAPPIAGRRCGTCGWRDAAGLCRQAGDPPAPVDAGWAACARWEETLDCQQCGACCRAAYHSVTVDRDDPVLERHPDVIVDRGAYLEIRRNGDRCAALDGGDGERPYACVIYDGRPQTCRDFERGGENCLIARRRVALTL